MSERTTQLLKTLKAWWEKKYGTQSEVAKILGVSLAKLVRLLFFDADEFLHYTGEICGFRYAVECVVQQPIESVKLVVNGLVLRDRAVAHGLRLT